MKAIWLAAFAALWGWCGTATAVGSIADVSVYDRREGRVLPVDRHAGRVYVAGTPGHEYQVRVRNCTGEDILAVVSVDGINAVSGETADWSQTGYVLGARESYDIGGWRKSMERVAAFHFTRHENSYAARTGRPDHVGVIGVAIFRKHAAPHARLRRDRTRHAAPAEQGADAGEPATQAESASSSDAGTPAAAPQPDRKIGTGHGRSEASHVTYTEFTCASGVPDEVIVIHYDTYRNLVAQGVIRTRAAVARAHRIAHTGNPLWPATASAATKT